MNGLVRYEKQVAISANERLTKADLELLQKAIRADYPELWWFNIDKMCTDANGFIVTINIQQVETSEIERLNKQLEDYIQGFAYQDLNSFHPVQKCYFLQSLLAKTVFYDKEEKDPFVQLHMRDIVGCFLVKRCVCAALGKGFKYLCDRFGVPCIYVTGVANNDHHGWNMVKIGPYFYHVDPTWNLDNHATSCYLLVDDRIIQRDHHADTYVPLPKAPSMAMNYYQIQHRRVHDCDISHEEQFTRILIHENQRMGAQSRRMVSVFFDCQLPDLPNFNFRECAIEASRKMGLNFILNNVYFLGKDILKFDIQRQPEDVIYTFPASGEERYGVKYIV